MPHRARHRPTIRRVLGAIALAVVAVSVTGCGAVWRSASSSRSVAPSGLPWGDELLRRRLAMGSFDAALVQLNGKQDGAPDDDLLRALFQGQVAFYAGQWTESAAAFAKADRLTEERYTKSASRGVLSLLTNDRVLRYVPARTERLFSPYYAMLARVQSGDVAGAAVDARRLSALLERSAGDLDPDERATHAALRDVAGAVFEAAGEWNDAAVSYRNAALLRGASPAEVDAIALQVPGGDSATLLVVVESGFVAHYVEQTLALPIGGPSVASTRRRARRVTPAADSSLVAGSPVSPTTLATFASAGTHTTSLGDKLAVTSRAASALGATKRDGRMVPVSARGETQRASTARDGDGDDDAVSAARWLAALEALPNGGVFTDDEPLASDLTPAADRVGDAASMSVASDWTPRRRNRTRYLGARNWSFGWLQISWPSLLRPRLPSAPIAVELAEASDTSGVPTVYAVPQSGAEVAELSDAIGADARRLRGARLARLTARTVTRVAAVDAVRDKHGEAAAAVAGLLASAVERADTRAWHLLPGRLSILRLTVPSGQVHATLRVGGTANGLPLALLPLNAAPGSAHVRSVRVWRDPTGANSGTLADVAGASGRESMPRH